jgi:hypothetical protein
MDFKVKKPIFSFRTLLLGEKYLENKAPKNSILYGRGSKKN